MADETKISTEEKCQQCLHPDQKGIHTCGKEKPVQPALTSKELKASLLEQDISKAIDIIVETQQSLGKGNEMVANDLMAQVLSLMVGEYAGNAAVAVRMRIDKMVQLTLQQQKVAATDEKK